MKTKLLVVTFLAMLGLAQVASAAINSSKVATGDGSSGSLTCLQDSHCQ
jgi:hypothetical protein